MEIYTTEEQQEEAIKKWLKENGAAVIIGIILGLAGLKGWNYWQERTLRQNAIASNEYETLQPMFNKVGVDEMAKQIDAFSTRNSNKVYFNFLNFELAKRAVSVANFDVAKAALNKVISNSANEVVESIAKIRLARIMILEKKPQQALKLLNIENKEFMSLVSEVRGDAYFALGDKAKARQAYEIAKTNNSANRPDNSLQMKIDDLALQPVELSKLNRTTTSDNQDKMQSKEDSAKKKSNDFAGEKG